MKLSWIVVNGPTDLVAEARGRLEMVSDAYLSVNTPAQNALPFWLSGAQTLRNEITGRLRSHHRILRELMARCRHGRLLEYSGGWYAIIRLDGNMDDEAFSIQMLRESNVLIHPGYFYDFDSGNHLIISLLPKPKLFREALHRLHNHLYHNKLQANAS